MSEATTPIRVKSVFHPWLNSFLPQMVQLWGHW